MINIIINRASQECFCCCLSKRSINPCDNYEMRFHCNPPRNGFPFVLKHWPIHPFNLVPPPSKYLHLHSNPVITNPDKPRFPAYSDFWDHKKFHFITNLSRINESRLKWIFGLSQVIHSNGVTLYLSNNLSSLSFLFFRVRFCWGKIHPVCASFHSLMPAKNLFPSIKFFCSQNNYTAKPCAIPRLEWASEWVSLSFV